MDICHGDTVVGQFHGLLISRSGLAAKQGVKLYFDPCLIDHDYRGEIKALLYNGGTEPYEWQQGERLCQIGYLPFYMGEAALSTQLSATHRGSGGFGSTGK
jgi:dUTP pyrophosphatase